MTTLLLRMPQPPKADIKRHKQKTALCCWTSQTQCIGQFWFSLDKWWWDNGLWLASKGIFGLIFWQKWVTKLPLPLLAVVDEVKEPLCDSCHWSELDLWIKYCGNTSTPVRGGYAWFNQALFVKISDWAWHSKFMYCTMKPSYMFMYVYT